MWACVSCRNVDKVQPNGVLVENLSNFPTGENLCKCKEYYNYIEKRHIIDVVYGLSDSWDLNFGDSQVICREK